MTCGSRQQEAFDQRSHARRPASADSKGGRGLQLRGTRARRMGHGDRISISHLPVVEYQRTSYPPRRPRGSGALAGDGAERQFAPSGAGDLAGELAAGRVTSASASPHPRAVAAGRGGGRAPPGPPGHPHDPMACRGRPSRTSRRRRPALRIRLCGSTYAARHVLAYAYSLRLLALVFVPGESELRSDPRGCLHRAVVRMRVVEPLPRCSRWRFS
jgi:hypothetical protein